MAVFAECPKVHYHGCTYRDITHVFLGERGPAAEERQKATERKRRVRVLRWESIADGRLEPWGVFSEDFAAEHHDHGHDWPTAYKQTTSDAGPSLVRRVNSPEDALIAAVLIRQRAPSQDTTSSVATQEAV